MAQGILIPPGQIPVVQVESTTFAGAELEKITTALGLKIGEPVDWRALDEGIRALGNHPGIQSLFVTAETSANGVKVTLRGTRLQIVSKITFTNVDAEILEELRGKLDLQEGVTVDARTFQNLKSSIAEAYELRGYYFANVSVEIKESSDQSEVEVEIIVSANEPTRIGKIRVTGGSKEENEMLESLLTLKRGDVFSRLKLESNTAAINRYLKANQYPTSKVEDSQVNFSTDKLEADITIQVRVEERFQFVFTGHKVLSDVELRVYLSDEYLVQTDAASKIAEAIEGKYKTLGFHFCKVSWRLTQRPQERLNVVTIEINEGPRVKVDKLEFSSAGGLSADELRQMFFQGAPGVLNRGVYYEEGIREATRQLSRQLHTLGFHRSRVSGPRVIFSEDRKGVQLFFEVDLGARVFITAIEFTGAVSFPEAHLRKLLTFREEEPLSQEKVKESRQKILEFYRLNGFSDVTFDPKTQNDGISLSSDGKSARVLLAIQEGMQYTIGEIRVEGLKKTQTHVVTRELRFKTGDRFRPDLLAKSEESLALLGLFSRIELLASPSNKDATKKDITVVLRETKPGVGEVGLGGVYEDPRFRMRAFSSIAYRNLFGLNQTVSARGELILPISRSAAESLIPFLEYSMVLGYRAPYPFSVPLTFLEEVTFDNFEVQAADPANNIQQKLQRRARLAARIEKRLSDSFLFNYRIHQLEHAVEETPSAQTQTASDTIGSTGPGFVIDLRDDIFNPTKGSLHTLHLEFAHPALLSQPSIGFVMAIFRNSFFVPLWRSLSLAFFGGVGYAKSIFPGNALPVARLRSDLNLGGQSSIRGLPVGKLMPPDNTEETAYANLRGEVNFTLIANASAAVFTDVGQIFPGMKGSPENFGIGVGVGFRYRTPVGPVVVDIARSLAPNSQPFFYLTVGSL